ncbi:hypothetical protein B0H13DRAFT_1112615 [Mycena leptocephala]|nr:hypothetical protein B0H13DRAFT_1112615 [Mycena leptocephala]
MYIDLSMAFRPLLIITFSLMTSHTVSFVSNPFLRPIRIPEHPFCLSLCCRQQDPARPPGSEQQHQKPHEEDFDLAQDGVLNQGLLQRHHTAVEEYMRGRRGEDQQDETQPGGYEVSLFIVVDEEEYEGVEPTPPPPSLAPAIHISSSRSRAPSGSVLGRRGRGCL